MFAMTMLASCTAPVNQPSIPTEEPAPPPSDPLVVGTQFPGFPAVQWTNGEPPPFGSDGVRGYVVDLWGMWCPFCREASGGLAKLAEEFQPQGIVFISMTNEGHIPQIQEQYLLKWHCGWNMTKKSLGELGAYNHEMAQSNQGYAVKPMTYLLNGNGEVLWCDQAARYQHKPASDWQPELRDQLLKLTTKKK